MRLDMGLCRCEVVIKGFLAKSVVRKLAPFSRGIAFTGTIGLLVFPSHYVNAVPCCTDAKALTPTASSQASEDIKNPQSNIQGISEAEYLEPSSAKIPTLSFEKDSSPLLLEDSSPEGKPLFHS